MASPATQMFIDFIRQMNIDFECDCRSGVTKNVSRWETAVVISFFISISIFLTNNKDKYLFFRQKIA